MEVLKCGIEVTPRLSNIKGIITAVSIRFNMVTYELTYFIEGKREIIWVDENELVIENSDKQKIGFKK